MENPSIFSLYKWSLWAKRRVAAARWLIALNRIVMGFIALYWGFFLADQGWPVAKAVFTVSAILYLTGFALYPRKKNRKRYSLQKFCDGLLIASSCAFWLAAGNYILQWQPVSGTGSNTVEVLQSAIAKDKTVAWEPVQHSEFLKKMKDKRGGFFKKIKIWKNRLLQKSKLKSKDQVAFIKANLRSLSPGVVVLLVLGSVAIFFFLGYLTIAAACSLSCNGQEAAAAVVVILGLLLIIGLIAWMWVATLRKNNRKVLKDQIREPSPPSSEPVPLSPSSVQIDHSEVRVCLELSDFSGAEEISLRLGDEILLENIQAAEAPHCIDLKLKSGRVNTLSVRGSSEPVKLEIEDGSIKKRMTLYPSEANISKVDLLLKGE